MGYDHGGVGSGGYSLAPLYKRRDKNWKDNEKLKFLWREFQSRFLPVILYKLL